MRQGKTPGLSFGITGNALYAATAKCETHRRVLCTEGVVRKCMRRVDSCMRIGACMCREPNSECGDAWLISLRIFLWKCSR